VLRCLPGLVVAAAIFAAPPVGALELRDDRGTLVRLAAPARRIVSLAPHLTEIAYAAGAGDRLAGAARFSDYPARALALPQVGDAARVDLERIIALQPDLVLAWRTGNQAGDIERLERLGYAVWVSEPSRLGDVARLIRGVGELAGTAAVAEQAAHAFETELAALRDRYGARTRVRAYYEIWHHPLMTVNGRHVISDVIALCGGQNVFAQARSLTPAITLESVIAARPQAILGGGSADDADSFSARWRSVTVGGLNRIPAYFVHPDAIQRTTPRLIDGARIICRDLDRVREGK
jgi:iron complex transport system substrate-binding protein